MIHIVGDVKHITAVACSGGIDSMAALSFLNNSKRRISAVFFNHGTEASEAAQSFLTHYCGEQGIPLITGHITGSKPKRDSLEAWWREQRYTFLHSLDLTIATAHHLNDVAETYLWGCLHGQPRFINYNKPHNSNPSNVVRPFLLTPKQELVAWCERKAIPWLEDASNTDIRFDRNLIRRNIMPEVLKVNPGFLKVVGRLLNKKLEGFDTM